MLLLKWLPGYWYPLGNGSGLISSGDSATTLKVRRAGPGDARLAPQVVVGVELDVAFGRGLQLDAGRGRDDLVDVEAAGLLDRRLPQPGAEVAGLGHVADHRVLAVLGLEGGDELLVVLVVQRLEVLHRRVEAGEVLAADAGHLVLGHRQRQQELLVAGDARGLELLVEGHVGAAHHRAEDAVGLGDLDLVDQRVEVGVAQRVVLLADHLAELAHRLDVLARDLHRGARPDVVGADQEEGLGLLLLGAPVQAVDDLLGGFLAGVDHVLGLLQAFVEGRVVQQAVFLLEHRQHGLARGAGPAAEHGGDLVVDEQLLALLGEGRPVGGAVFLDDLDLAAEDAAHRVDLVDGELLGLDRAGLADRHRAGGRVQLAHRHLGVGDRELGGVHLGGGELLRERPGRDACERQRGGALQQAAALQRFQTLVLVMGHAALLEGWGQIRARGTIAVQALDAWPLPACRQGTRRAAQAEYVIRRSGPLSAARQTRAAAGTASCKTAWAVLAIEDSLWRSPRRRSSASAATTTAGSPTRRWRTTPCATRRGTSASGARRAWPTPPSVPPRSSRSKPSAAPSR